MRLKLFLGLSLAGVLAVAAFALAGGFTKSPALIATTAQPAANAEQPPCADCCPECIACCAIDGCCIECMLCCIEMGCDPFCCLPTATAEAEPHACKPSDACTGSRCCK